VRFEYHSSTAKPPNDDTLIWRRKDISLLMDAITSYLEAKDYHRDLDTMSDIRTA